MALAISLTVAAVAGLTWWFAVPRVRIDDPEAPDLAALVTPRSVVLVSLAALAAAQVLWIAPAWTWVLLVPYLAFGTPLVAVDWATTWLPRRLQQVAATALVPGAVFLGVTDPGALVWAVVGAAVAFGFFLAAWRLSGQLGFGDVLLAGTVGLVAGQSGPQQLALALLLGSALGVVVGVVHRLRRVRHPELPSYFAYGPTLWLGVPAAYAVAPLLSG